MYNFPKSFTKEKIKKFFKTKNNMLHKELEKCGKRFPKQINNNDYYSIILSKILENYKESKKYNY